MDQEAKTKHNKPAYFNDEMLGRANVETYQKGKKKRGKKAMREKGGGLRTLVGGHVTNPRRSELPQVGGLKEKESEKNQWEKYKTAPS